MYVSKEWTEGAWLFAVTVTAHGVIEEWNGDGSKIKIRITDSSSGYYVGQTIWESTYSWGLDCY